ncbi:MAG: cmpC [Verrucomicrobiales bacterium]|nr:cmpC [Verrucomicrobiales bacterium]
MAPAVLNRECMTSHSWLSRNAPLRIGYVPLTDAAPLIAARRLGLFEKHGVQVELSRELGWGTIRDKIVYNELDAAHAPGGLLFSLLAGTHSAAVKVRALMLLSCQGNAITLSRRLWEKGARDGKSLKKVIRVESPRCPVFAVVAWYSTHHHLLRLWLREAGIDPDKQVRITVLPPPLVGEHMRAGLIDGFCAGEPWNSAAVMQGEGWIAATSRDLAPGHPEKILFAQSSRMDSRPEDFAALRAALREACGWCESPENRPELAALLKQEVFPCLPLEVVRNALTGPCDLGAGVFTDPTAFHRFATGDGCATTVEQAVWTLQPLEEGHLRKLTPAQRLAAIAAWLNQSEHSPSAIPGSPSPVSVQSPFPVQSLS